MKTLKKIHLGTKFTPKQMTGLLGGANVNKASFCGCDESTNSTDKCNNNTNYSWGCSCWGNNSNTNTEIRCSCK